MEFFKKAIVVLSLISLTACSSIGQNASNSTNPEVQEDIYLKSKNYTGLINMYRSFLKNKEDAKVRFKLASYYYQDGDYKSSLYYLQPLMQQPDLNIYALQAKIMISLGDYPQALRTTERMLTKDNQYAEAYNLKGITLAMMGKYADATAAFQKSRDLFIEDDVALNNMAMVYLLDQRYQDAVGVLLPQYLRGRKQDRMLRNLVIGLVKVGDMRYAQQIVKAENMSEYPDELVDLLSRLGPIKNEVK